MTYDCSIFRWPNPMKICTKLDDKHIPRNNKGLLPFRIFHRFKMAAVVCSHSHRTIEVFSFQSAVGYQLIGLPWRFSLDKFKLLQKIHYSTCIYSVRRQVIMVNEVIFILIYFWELR